MATILYVDDEEAVRRAIRAYLVRRGHTVHEAGTIDGALRILADQPIDTVVIDLWLGAESGFDLFEWIDLQRPALAQRSVFVTGDVVREPDVERTLAIYDRPVLVKPFPLGELDRLITSWGPS